MQRRRWIKQVAAGGAALAVSPVALAEKNSGIDSSIAEIAGDSKPVVDPRVELHVPADTANGAVVPVGVVSQIPETKKIVLLVSAHGRANVMSVNTEHKDLSPRFSAHLQLLEPATITALVQTPDGWFSNQTKVDSLGERC